MTVPMLSVKMVVRVMMVSTTIHVIVLQDMREITVKRVRFFKCQTRYFRNGGGEDCKMHHAPGINFKYCLELNDMYFHAKFAILL